tara:strand:+ start:2003 stop:2710 length:708 start_codon:yes stop_codon:yes gene_type:complete
MTKKKSLDSPKVLFFARKDCNYSYLAEKHLKQYDLNINTVISSKRNEDLSKEIKDWSGDYIFCFRSLYIIPKILIDDTNKYVINFHPGPPDYPGSGSVNLALYNSDKEFGVTAHLINEKIDNGDIIECLKFPIEDKDDSVSLLEKTHKNLLTLFIKIVDEIFAAKDSSIEKKIEENKDKKWIGEANTISLIDNLQMVDPSITKEELERLITSVHTDDYPLKISIHDYDFYLKRNK